MNILNKILLLFSIAVLLFSCRKDKTIPFDQIAPTIPFPAHIAYLGEHISPTNYSQTELDNQTKDFYKEWKEKYVKNDCVSNQFYINTTGAHGNVSEGQGYGMMIMAYMAGYEKSAQFYFNGLFAFVKAHSSRLNSNLMDWEQQGCNDAASDEDDAASDGDIDIAFSLLLAHAQWGSSGKVNYLAEAKKIITAIMADEVNAETTTVKLGDWCIPSNSYYYGTRTSDFILSHFKVFAVANEDSKWNDLIDKCYTLINQVQNPTTGLVPDFIINTNTTPTAAPANYLESEFDGNYYYNACRFPWRISTDFLLTGDERAKLAVNKINTWLFTATAANAENISNGYLLNGSAINDWNDATFIAPFTVSAMLNTEKQDWLNHLYKNLLLNNDFADGDYYSNTIKLLSMITISGNSWNP